MDEERAGCVRRYFRDMHLAMAEMLRTLKPDRYAVLVVADSNLRGIVVPTGACLIEIAESLDVDGVRFVHRDTLVRTIRERSRQMPIKRGRNGDGMKTEEVLILQRRPARTLVAVGARNGHGIATDGNAFLQNGRKPHKTRKPQRRAEASENNRSVNQAELGRSGVNRDKQRPGHVRKRDDHLARR